MSIELDHIFWMVPKADVAGVTDQLGALGLRESYRRRHPGQGTANVCFCFENAFLEVLWLEDEAEARSAPIARTLLAERATGKANQFGVCWRGDAGLPMWAFAPPYLPPGVTIPIAIASDDPELPLLFSFPRAKPPIEMAWERHGGMQAEVGFARLEIEVVRCGQRQPDDLRGIASQMTPPFEV
ncbi:MAG: VOC family protein, partial [Pseudomonadota bacterium]